MEQKSTALITGASAGIGRELSRLFAKDGIRLVLVARRRELLEELAAELRTQHSVEILTLAADLARHETPAEIANELAKREIAIDFLVNNAGVGNYGMFATQDPAACERMIDINIRALTMLTRQLLPGMIERKRGRILNVASTSAFQPGPTMAVYYATKAYVLSLSEALTNECQGTGVTVTCLCPGPTETEFMQAAGINDATLRKTGWLMSARDVAVMGYRAMHAGKRLVIPGFVNSFVAFSVRLVPRAVVLRISRMVLTRGQ